MIALAHRLHGEPSYICDPLTREPVAFTDDDLGFAVAAMLANAGYMAIRVVEAPDTVHVVTDEHEALILTRLLAAELRLHQHTAALAATTN